MFVINQVKKMPTLKCVCIYYSHASNCLLWKWFNATIRYDAIYFNICLHRYENVMNLLIRILAIQISVTDGDIFWVQLLGTVTEEWHNILSLIKTVMVSRVVTGLLTEHTTLRKHLHLMGLIDSPLCRKCGAEDETSAHVLCQCEALASLRHAPSFWSQRILRM
jgi:hypothetical protein